MGCKLEGRNRPENRHDLLCDSNLDSGIVNHMLHPGKSSRSLNQIQTEWESMGPDAKLSDLFAPCQEYCHRYVTTVCWGLGFISAERSKPHRPRSRVLIITSPAVSAFPSRITNTYLQLALIAQNHRIGRCGRLPAIEEVRWHDLRHAFAGQKALKCSSALPFRRYNYGT